MAMLLDYGQKTVQIAPYKKATLVSPSKSVGGKTVVQGTTKTVMLPVKQQIAYKTAPQALQEALKPTATVVKVPLAIGASLAANRLVNQSLPVGNVKTVTSSLTTKQKEAIIGAYQTKYGQAVVSSPANQATIAKLRTIAIVQNLKKSGLEIAPSGTKDYLYTAEQNAAIFRDEVNALLGQQEQWVTKQKEYQNTLSAREMELAKGTAELGYTKGQLEQVTGEYLTLQEKYNQLLENPPSQPGMDIFGGLGDFIAKYGLWIALGVGAIILLPSILNIFNRK